MTRYIKVGLTLAAVALGSAAVFAQLEHPSERGAADTRQLVTPRTTPVKAAATGARTVVVSADYSVIYTDVSQLAVASDVVVRGIVREVSYVNYNEGVFTVSKVEVRKSWGGRASAGDIITVVEEGGVTTEAYLKRTTGRPLDAPITTREEQAEVRVLLDGAPTAKPGEVSTYFLVLGSWDIVPAPYYECVGGFQGKFRVNGGKATRHAPPEWSASYRALDGNAARLEAAIERAAKR